MISIRSASDSSGEYSRIGAATTRLHIARQPQHHIARHAVQMLDFFRQDGAHPDGGIARQAFQGFDGERHDVSSFRAPTSPGIRRAILTASSARTSSSFVVGQKAIDAGRRGRIGGHRLRGWRARHDSARYCNTSAPASALRRARSCALAGADFQNVQRLARIQALTFRHRRIRRCGRSRLFSSPSPLADSVVGQGFNGR